MDWQNHSLIRLTIPFTLGMVGANLFISHMNMMVLFILCCVVLALAFFLIRTSSKLRDNRFGVVAMALFFLIGMTLYTGKHQRVTSGFPIDTAFCRGILVEPPKEKAYSWALRLEQENGTHILIYIGKKWRASDVKRADYDAGRANYDAGRNASEQDSAVFASLQIGDTILANIRHLRATNLCKDDSFRTYRMYLFHQGICATAYTPHDQWLVRSCKNHRSLLMSAKALQERLHEIYDDRGISGETGSIIEAVTIGRKTDLSPDTRTTYANAGISHMLALSGFHVGIIVLMIQVFFLKHILLRRWQWVSNLLIIATLWGYALLTGLSPSLVRATTMFTILQFCQFLFRENISPNACAFAFVFMLCINPFYLYDIGFQLSFVAVGAIGVFTERFTLSCPTHNPILRFFWNLILITVICTLFTAPLAAYHFGRIPLISFLSNLLLFPFIYLLMGATILWWAFLWCDSINGWLTDLLNWTAGTMSSIVERLSTIPYVCVEWHPGIPATLLSFGVLVVLSYCFTQRNRILTFRHNQMQHASRMAPTTK